MILVSCSACKTPLEVDDAFAGGVCRCSSCGAIQTVPKTASPDTPLPASGKTLFRKKGQAVVGSGLDELAQVVASSGLSAARSKRGSSPSAAIPDATSPSPLTSKRKLWFLIAGLGFGMFLGVLYVLIASGPTPPSPTDPTNPSSASNSPDTTPTLFISLDLTPHNSVIFLIDRGAASADALSPLKQVILRTLYRLGKNKQFALLFWDNGTPPATFPARGFAYAVPESISSARQQIDDIVAFGQSSILSQLSAAAALNPDAIVIISAKGFDLDDAWADSVLATFPPTNPPVLHTLSIGSVGPSTGLKRLSEKTRGTYLELSAESLRDLAGQ